MGKRWRSCPLHYWHVLGNATATFTRSPRGTSGLIFAVPLAFVTVTRVAEPLRVASASMTASFGAGDEVLIDKFSHRSSHPRRDDSIVIRRNGTGKLLIKRVVALAGETVGISDGVLVVNGRLIVEPYVEHGSVDGNYFGPVLVPAGSVFVLGDNRATSIDSCVFGAAPLPWIVGRVRLHLG